MEFLDALKLPFQAIGAARSLARDPFYFDKYNQEQALLQQEAQNKEQMRSGLAGLLQGQADKSGIIWNDTLTPQQKYTNSLVQLAMADPKYAAVAADSANPLSQLDELTKRAELANKESEQKLKNFRINQTLQQYGFGGQSQPSGQPSQSSPLSVRNNNFGNLRNTQRTIPNHQQTRRKSRHQLLHRRGNVSRYPRVLFIRSSTRRNKDSARTVPATKIRI